MIKKNNKPNNQNPRIITGTYKNVSLYVSDSARPVTDRVKRTIFDILSSYVIDTKAADIFAGSGNLGIEALSRGAKHLTFVDPDLNSVNTIRKNLEKIKASEENFRIIKLDYAKYIKKFKKDSFDLIFIDPPFELFSDFKIFLFLKILNPGGVLVLKSPFDKKKTKHPKSLELIEYKKIGINHIYFFRKVISTIKQDLNPKSDSARRS